VAFTTEPSSKVTYAGKVLSLTPKEYMILELFLKNPTRLFNRSSLLNKLWTSINYYRGNRQSSHNKFTSQVQEAGSSENIIEKYLLLQLRYHYLLTAALASTLRHYEFYVSETISVCCLTQRFSHQY